MTEPSRPRLRNAIVYNMGFDRQPAKPVNADTPLASCIALLRQRHEAVLNALGNSPQTFALEANLLSLRLAEAFTEKVWLNQSHPGHPLQIAVIGPTQSGKSTVVNLLLGQDRARVSPLAGYTVHPQGFPVNVKAPAWGWLDEYFRDYRRCEPGKLPTGQYDFYALDESPVSALPALPPSVVWDTPDFDSVDSADYRRSVLRTAALADVVLLVVSKDKYADQSVWDTMALLEPLAQPTLVCLNKLSVSSHATLIRSLREKWRAARQDPPPRLAVLPWLDEPQQAIADGIAAELLQGLTEALDKADRAAAASHGNHLAATHWQAWLSPIRQEWSAKAEWEGMVESACQEALAIYRRDFLDHPHHYETFQRALAELLTLLEIPGLAGGMVMMRNAITWPARQLMRLGSGWRGQRSLGQEALVLTRTLEHLFIQLGQATLDKASMDSAMPDYWRALGLLLREERLSGEPARAKALARHAENFQPEIERTAHQLHERLQEHPAVLNTLRATRVTADATALGLALHSGGIGVQDFIIAPAVLSVTSLLAEGALGRYLHRAEAELKERQYQEAVRLFSQVFAPVLTTLPDKINQQGRFNIPLDMVKHVEGTLL